MALLRWPHSSRKILPNGLSEALKPGHEKADEIPFAAHSHFAKRPILENLLIQWKTGRLKDGIPFLPMRPSYYSKMKVISNF